MPKAGAQRVCRSLLLATCVLGAPAVFFACSDASTASAPPVTPPGDDATASAHDASVSGEKDSSASKPDTSAPPPKDDAGSDDDADAGSAFPDPSTFTCNLFIGVSVTGDWFGAGFETGIDGDRWEAKWQSLAFVEKWANPSDAVWAQALTSACPKGATAPDRVIFTGVNWTFTTEAEWETQLTAVVETLKTKYAGLKEIDLMTMLRAPGNKVCGNPGSPEQVVAPFIDDAIAATAAKYPSLVRAAPKFFAPSCDVFQPNSPHFADGGAATIGKLMQDYYKDH